MLSVSRALAFSALLSLVSSQAVILKAVGDKGESAPLQLDLTNPADNNFIADAEIRENIVNECGRTALGNIDIGEQSEINLSKNAVTSVKKGGNLVLTIKQVNQQGAGPFTCDLDLTNNSNGLAGQTALTTKEAKNGQNIEVTATMPNNLKCIGGSTGDLCMVRCRNAQNFGGCVAIQQSDVTPNQNTPDNIKTGATLKQVLDQVNQDLRDFKVSTESTAKSSIADQGKDVALALVASNTASGVLADTNTTRVAAPAKNNNNNAAKKNNNNAAKKNNNNAAKKNNNNNAAAAKKNNNNNAAAKKNNNAAAAAKKNNKRNVVAAADAAATEMVKRSNSKRDSFRRSKRQTAENVEQVQVDAAEIAPEEFDHDEE